MKITGSVLSLLISLNICLAGNIQFIKDDFIHGLQNGIGLITAPLHFDHQDWRNTGLTLAGTALLFSIDKPIQKLALKNHNPVNDIMFNVDKIHGNKYDLYLSGGVYILGLLSSKPGIRMAGLNATEAYLFSGAITGVGKVLLGRKRPYASDSPIFFSPFHWTENRFHSLPSGHTTVSFAVSTVMAKSWDNTAWKIFWYGNAGLVAASRIYHNKHWFSDTFLGAVVGYSVANFIINSDTEKFSQRKYRIVPVATLNSIRLDICLY
ncbi:MAG: phosphatase PAP2 family protein [Candidatus Marinimicrobia bacterium]|nr:phosphatase PAP2 family protein [Candidatus Neomarinimicrobiota bacterium]